MIIEMPEVIQNYYDADKKKAGSISVHFTPDAVVIDEGNTYKGSDEIDEWQQQASTEYSYTVEPFALDAVDDKTVVTAHLRGNFPGSPVDLRYIFGLSGGQIESLEIKP